MEDLTRNLALLEQRLELLPGEAAPTALDTSVHRLKVTLRGSKPPIWRRVEVLSSTQLVRLHQAIQDSFAWEDYHSRHSTTPHGEYGMRDPELGHGDATTVTLAEVAGKPEGPHRLPVRLRERVGPRRPGGGRRPSRTGCRLPRCLTGRRAAPPEDSGGIWGYAHLCDVLADPGHPEHADRLEWLDLDSATDFDPAAFDADEVNDYLSRQAKVPIKP